MLKKSFVLAGYNSDSENNPANTTPVPRPMRTTRLRTPLTSSSSVGRQLSEEAKHRRAGSEFHQEAKTPVYRPSPSTR